jgi:hypothetical protein
MAVKRPNHHRTRGRPNPTARPPKRIKRATASFFSLTSYAVGLTCRRIAGNLLLNHTYALHSVFTLHKSAGEKNNTNKTEKGFVGTVSILTSRKTRQFPPSFFQVRLRGGRRFLSPL